MSDTVDSELIEQTLEYDDEDHRLQCFTPDRRPQVGSISDRGDRFRTDARKIDSLINRIVYFPNKGAAGEGQTEYLVLDR